MRSNELTPRDRSRQVGGSRWALPGAGLVFVSVLGSNLLDFGACHLRFSVFDASADSSWSHRATAVTLITGTGIALLAARHSTRDRARWLWTCTVLALLFVSESSPLHTQIDRVSYGKLFYVPLLAMLVINALGLATGSEHARLIRIGLALLFASFAIHVFGTPLMHELGWDAGSWSYQVKVGVKQGTELAGWVLVVLALWCLMTGRGRAPDEDALPGARSGRDHRSVAPENT